MIYENRADLLEAAAKSIRMQDAAGLEPVCKILKNEYSIAALALTDVCNDYEFPIAVIEGKLVFVGDKLWCLISGHYFTVKGLCNSGHALEYTTMYQGRMCVPLHSCSWNPPKPKTMVLEIPIEDAKALALKNKLTIGELLAAAKRLEDNMRAALEKLE